jgi:hypothetical protein
MPVIKEYKEKMRYYGLLLKGLLTVALVFSACAGSSVPDIKRIQEILGSGTEAPVFRGCRPLSAAEIAFRFSRPVRVVSLAFDPAAEVESLEEGADVTVHLAEPLKGGEKLTADILVEDEERNTLNVLVPFTARNDNMPALVINEIRTEYSKPKVEFVEFKTASGGNLGGIRLFIAGHSISTPVYEFPPTEVEAGEYIVLHLRTLSGEPGAVNETGSNLGLSGGYDAKPGARDFWIPGSEKLLHSTDAVYLLDQDDRVVDAVMLSPAPDPWWTKDHFVQAADMLYQQGAWMSAEGKIPGPVEAVSSAQTSPSRTICRDTEADNNTLDNWYTTVTSGATPGTLNNPNHYVAP